MKNFFRFLLVIVLFSSCGEYHQIVKSGDYNLMYDKAREYYNKGDYTKAKDLFNTISAVYIGTARAQTIAYYKAFCSFGQRNYEEAAEYFRQFLKQYPESPSFQECLYYVGYCNYLSSPNPRLDQTATQEAIKDFQTYLNRYPNSHRKDLVNEYLELMWDKLAQKDYLSAENYYKRERWVSAIVSLNNCLKDYPGTRHREKIMYMLFNSKYELAVNSYELKQYERFTEAKEEYYYFVDEYPNSEYAQDMTRKYEVINRFLDQYDQEEEEED